MNDEYLDDTIETSTEETAPKGNLTTKQYKEVAESAERNRQSELRSLSQTLGTIARQDENAALTRQALHVDTLDNVIRTTKNINVDEEGKLQFPEIPMPDGLTKDEEKAYSVLQNQARESMQYVLDKYNEDRQSVGGDVHYIAGSALRSAVDLVAESAALAPQIAGMGIQFVGTLGDDKDNWAIRNGTLLQEWTASRLDDLHNGMTKALNLKPAQTSDVAKTISKGTDTAFQVGAVMAGAYAGGLAGATKATAIATGRKVSKEVAERYAKQWANKVAKRVEKGSRVGYAAAQTEDYLLRPRQGKTSEEYLEYLRAKTGGEILSDLAWATVVGLSNYYLEGFGANASIQNFFGDAASGLVKLATRRAGEEGLTEIAQDQVLNVADLIRGRMSVGEFASNLISPETLETFVISAIIGGATATGEYATTRMKLVKEYKTNLKKAFPDATEKQLETAGQAFINSVEDNVVGKVHQSIIADDQLKNGYGTYNKIVQNRINKLINDSIAQGKELAFKDTSPEYQAQFVGSASQQFVDELYAQAVLRGVPVNEVFDVTKMDVENGILYMYGAEYGKRPLTQFTRDMTPAQWEQAQLEKRAAEELQRKTKEEQAQVQKALKEAQKQEKAEEKRKVSYEASLPYREYLSGRGFQESELDDKQAVQQARTMAKNEIRTMPEDNARGVLATLRDDLPVESMTATEIRQILRSELERFMALQDKNSIEPIAKAPSIEKRQAQIVRRVRMAKPKSFSETVKSFGISKDVVERLGLVGELKNILDKNYRFFVRRNGVIDNFEEFAADYQRDGDSYQGTVNGFLELLEKDLATKDIYTTEQDDALKKWQERSIRAGKEEEARLADLRDQEVAELTAYLQEAGYDTSTMTDDDILAQGRLVRDEERARMDTIDSDINIDVDDDLIFSDSWLHSVKEANDLAEENARLDEVNPEYKGETIEIEVLPEPIPKGETKEVTIGKKDWETPHITIWERSEYANLAMPTIVDFFVPEEERGTGKGKALLKEAVSKYKNLSGQFSSKKAAKIFYDLGGRLAIDRNATLEDIYKIMDRDSSAFLTKVETVKKPTKNSDGQPIAKSEPALRNFWNWFGDSKVVDENGRPLVVYHGTNEEFDEFDIRYFGRHDNGWLGVGFYTTNDEEMAESYGSIVMPLYTKLENPYILTASDASYNPDHLRNKLGVRTGMEINEYLRNNGYDGVLLSYTDDWGFAFREAMALERNQIKSTQNRGTFSSDTGNIYYQNVEEKDLIVQHGTTLYKLKEALELGGMPVPSLAVMKAEHSNKQYGEITFVGGRNVIEGEQVYTSDIYSTRRLKPTSVLNKKGEKKLRELVGGRMYFIAGNLPDLEGTSKGEDLFMHLYLLEKGLRTDPENTLTRNSVDYVEELNKMSETEKADYVEWTKNFMSEYFDKKLFAGYTPSGNQRLLDYNMQNIVKLMSKEKKVASEYGASTSAHALKGIWAKPLKTIKDIQKNKDRLVDSEAYKEADDQFWTSMRLLTDLLTTEESDKIVAQRYIANSEYVVEVLAQIKKSTNIKQLLADNKLNDSAEAVQAVKDFKTFAENVPTKYFEAKPYRAVDFKEFEAVLMPSDTEYNQAAEQLEGMGLTVLRYSSEQERAEQIQTLKPIMFQTKGKSALGQRNLAAWNPLRRSIELFTGANETSIMHELSHFWLDNMMLYSRLESAARDSGFAKVWNNIKKYLNIDDRQERINESQAEKYTSAYMQYIRNTKIAPVVDLGFKGMDEFIGDISLDYFENAKHREADGTITSELEIITPEMVDTFQKLTTTDLNAARDLVASLQDREFTDGAIDSQLGEESTPEQMKTAVAKQERETRQKIAEKSTQNAERDSTPTDIPQDSKTMQNAQNRLDKEKSTYEVGTTDEESFAKAREIIAKDRARAEEIVAIDPNGITDGIANSFIALELARQAVANGKNAMPYLESFVNGASASGANLRTANLLNTPEFAWAKDMYEASKAKNYAIALRMRPAARNAIMHRSRIAQTFESKLDQYVEELYPQLLQAQTYEEQVKIINEWANNTAKKIGVEPTSEVWGQSVKGTSAKKTEFSKEVVYQKRKLKEFLKSKIGATLTDAEQLKIRQLHTNTIDAMRQLQTNPNDIETAKEFIRKAREYQDYLNALAPVNWANALFSSIPRASMLFRISTQVKNTVGTRLEILLSDLNRQLRYGKDNLISKKDRDAEIKKSMEMFLIGGFSPDVQENFFETPILAWGEKQYSMIQRGGERRGAVFSKERLAQDKADIANYISDNWKSGDGAGKKALVAGRIGIAVAEKMTGKAYDVLAYSDAYMKAIIATHETAKAATFYAQTIGKEKGWTKEQIKEYAEMLFKDARSYIPKTKLGIAIRKQAVEQAKIETFIKNGTISTFANSVRKGINLGKDSGIGTFISPYVSTAANIMQIGIDYTTGWWRRFDGWKDVKNRIYENAKKGEPIDQKDMEYLEKGYRGTYGGLFLLTMLALFKGAQALTGEDDTLDYVPPYSQLTPRERAYYKQVNGGKYNAVKIVDVWVSAEYFGGLSNAITNLGTWYHANSIISAAKGMIAETPVIGDLVEQHDKLQQDITYDKGVIDIAMASVLNQAEKYIPGIGKDIYKTIDEGRILYPFFGSSVGLTVSDEAKTVLDVQRESKATYTSISRSKPFNKLSKEDKRKLDDEFNKEYISEANKWIQRNPNATPEQQKKALDAIRKKIREKLKRKYKVK